MITYIRYKTSEFILDKFSSLLESPNDVVHQPVDTALEYRLDDFNKNQYAYPFLSFDDDPVQLNEGAYNHVLSSHNGAEITLGGDVFRVKFYPVEYNIEVNFWVAQQKDVVDTFNRLWVANKRDGAKKTITYPFLDSNDEETSDTLDFDTYFQFGELTDNSAIERQYETGVHFRLTGEMTIQQAYIFDPVLPDKYPRIQKIFVDFLEKQEDVDNILLDEVTIQ